MPPIHAAHECFQQEAGESESAGCAPLRILQFRADASDAARQKASKAALDTWFHEAQRAEWRNSAEVKRSYRSASVVSADRVVFNIKGNDYRLVTAIDYRRKIVFIKWLGTHRDYDQIDARTIEYGD